MSKQTAVEFFFNELQRMQYFIGNDMLQAYNEAKAMEREQIMNAWAYGVLSQGDKTAEQYYTETYGGEE